MIALVGGTDIQIQAKFKRYKVTKEKRAKWEYPVQRSRNNGGATTLIDHDQPWYIFVYFPVKPRMSSPDDVGQVVHEMLHAASRILRRKGVELCDESEEAFTYLNEFLVRDFFEQLKN